MQKITEELKRIKDLQSQIGYDFFIYESKYKEEMEMLIVGYHSNLLKLSGLPYPIYVEKRNNQNPPDFNTYDIEGKLLNLIEVTECLKPNRKRHQEYKNNESRGKFEYNHDNLESLLNRLNKKFLSQYSNTDLVIYININIHDISSLGFWHRIILNIVQTWISEGKLDINKCSFDNVFVIDSNGKRLLKIFPEFDLIYTPESIEWNF